MCNGKHPCFPPEPTIRATRLVSLNSVVERESVSVVSFDEGHGTIPSPYLLSATGLQYLRGIMEKNAEFCRFCGFFATNAVRVRDRHYARCERCGGITLNREFLPAPEAERARYDLHRNSLADPGYRAWLEGFLDDAFRGMGTRDGSASASVRTVLDYGSGPEPALVTLLRERGLDARGWDPYYAPAGGSPPDSADLVTCLEVAEHFFEPARSFADLASRVRPGGWLAVGTRTVPDTPFERWWYREDSTHVAFWTERAFELCAADTGLQWLGRVGQGRFLFRKPASSPDGVQ